MGGDKESKGERVFRSNYKGHMDKTRKGGRGGSRGGGGGAWGGGEWWGVNADNGTWTTIK